MDNDLLSLLKQVNRRSSEEFHSGTRSICLAKGRRAAVSHQVSIETDRKIETEPQSTKLIAYTHPDPCFIVDGDLGIRSTGELLTQVAIAKTGRLDLVVNNAGIFVPGNFHDHTEEHYS
ncbi:hypothetical protein [Chamaesiphon sp.]|uniref:hypothetical protein n=1 Tax=Chamaesiphon sp. TaxID=2814140 RepID=UPI0035930190